jgi:plastocyanin
LSASFSENPVLIDPVKNPNPIIAVDIKASRDLTGDQYVMLVGASNGLVSLSTFLFVNVTQPSNLPGWEAYSLAALAGLIAIATLAIRRRRNKAAVGKPPSRSFHSFMEDHKVEVMILGVASTNFVGAIAGLLHLLISQAPTRVVPLSNSSLATYGYYAFWLDVTELALGLITVHAVLLAWKPSRQIKAAILLVVMIIASTLIAASVWPGARPAQCDIVIRNSLFHGNYSPSSFQTTIHGTVTVTWCVDGNSVHADTVTSDTGLFNSGPIAQGSSWSYTFVQPGEYGYHSIAHFWMHGTVSVASEEQASPAASFKAMGDLGQNRVRSFEERSWNAPLVAEIARLGGKCSASESLESVR